MATPEIQKNYTCKSLSEIWNLSAEISAEFPYPKEQFTGIYELLVNAVEHGNLEIGYALKTSLLKKNKAAWEAEIEKRMADSMFKDRAVQLVLKKNSKECRLSITDQGRGFNWQYFLKRTPDRAIPNGRGLLIAQRVGFSILHFNNAGNQVTCISRFISSDSGH